MLLFLTPGEFLVTHVQAPRVEPAGLFEHLSLCDGPITVTGDGLYWERREDR